jgi:hypothetical protein
MALVFWPFHKLSLLVSLYLFLLLPKGTAKVEKAYMASHLFQSFSKQRQSLRALLRLGLEQAGHLAHFPRVSVRGLAALCVLSFQTFKNNPFVVQSIFVGLCL